MLRISPEGDKHNLYDESRKHYSCISSRPSLLQTAGRHLHYMKLVYGCAALLNTQHRGKKITAVAGRDNVLKASPHQLY